LMSCSKLSDSAGGVDMGARLLGSGDVCLPENATGEASMPAMRPWGYDVAIPQTESAAYDLVVDDGDQLIRVLSRHSRTRSGGRVWLNAAALKAAGPVHPGPGVRIPPAPCRMLKWITAR